MTREKSPAQTLLDDIVKRAVTSVLKPIGFRKSAANFHRRHHDVVQVVNLQASRGSTWDEKLVYVNVGIAFDAICRLTNIEILEKPKESECDARGTRDRLEKLVANAPSVWTIDVGCDPDALAQQLGDCMRELAVELQEIDGVQAYREHRWFDRFRPKRENAQGFYILGNLDDAWKEIHDLCTLFADRQNVCRPLWWIENLGLRDLAARVEPGESG